MKAKTYILEKLKGVGCNQTIFEDAAIEAILNAADGTPRLINKYCNAKVRKICVKRRIWLGVSVAKKSQLVRSFLLL